MNEDRKPAKDSVESELHIFSTGDIAITQSVPGMRITAHIEDAEIVETTAITLEEVSSIVPNLANEASKLNDGESPTYILAEKDLDEDDEIEMG